MCDQPRPDSTLKFAPGTPLILVRVAVQGVIFLFSCAEIKGVSNKS
jgi:hypothetical protein